MIDQTRRGVPAVLDNSVDVIDEERFKAWAYSVEAKSRSILSGLIVRAYAMRFLRRACLGSARRLEGGDMHSVTLRQLLLKYHSVFVGSYSYGPCLQPGVLPPGTTVGRYCSFAEGLRVYRRNHPVDRISQHPFFFNCECGLVLEDTIPQIEDNPLAIGNDVWVGSRVTILPTCCAIGDGAVIGAGSVVAADVPAFTVVGGVPARVMKERFSPEVRSAVEDSKWWELPLTRLVSLGPLFAGKANAAELRTWIERL